MHNIISPFSRVVSYREATAAAFLTTPRSVAVPDGWGEPWDNTLGTANGPKATKKLFYKEAHGDRPAGWQFNSRPGTQVYGNIDWKGEPPTPAEGEQPDMSKRPVLTFWGPKSRHFPEKGFTYNQEKCHFVYQRGGYLAALPYPVLGAGIWKDTEEVYDPELGQTVTSVKGEYLLVVCWQPASKQSLLMIRPLPDSIVPGNRMTPELKVQMQAMFNVATNPNGWRVITGYGQSAGGGFGVENDPQTPWFFSGSGKYAFHFRRTELTINNGMEITRQMGVNMHTMQMDSPNRAEFEIEDNPLKDEGFIYNIIGHKRSSPVIMVPMEVTQSPLYANGQREWRFGACDSRLLLEPEYYFHEWERHLLTVDSLLLSHVMNGRYIVSGDWYGDTGMLIGVRMDCLRKHEQYWRFIADSLYDSGYVDNINNSFTRLPIEVWPGELGISSIPGYFVNNDGRSKQEVIDIPIVPTKDGATYPWSLWKWWTYFGEEPNFDFIRTLACDVAADPYYGLWPYNQNGSYDGIWDVLGRTAAITAWIEDGNPTPPIGPEDGRNLTWITKKEDVRLEYIHPEAPTTPVSINLHQYVDNLEDMLTGVVIKESQSGGGIRILDFVTKSDRGINYLDIRDPRGPFVLSALKETYRTTQGAFLDDPEYPGATGYEFTDHYRFSYTLPGEDPKVFSERKVTRVRMLDTGPPLAFDSPDRPLGKTNIWSWNPVNSTPVPGSDGSLTQGSQRNNFYWEYLSTNNVDGEFIPGKHLRDNFNMFPEIEVFADDIDTPGWNTEPDLNNYTEYWRRWSWYTEDSDLTDFPVSAAMDSNGRVMFSFTYVDANEKEAHRTYLSDGDLTTLFPSADRFIPIGLF